jgi:hypothetical protein
MRRRVMRHEEICVTRQQTRRDRGRRTGGGRTCQPRRARSGMVHPAHRSSLERRACALLLHAADIGAGATRSPSRPARPCPVAWRVLRALGFPHRRPRLLCTATATQGGRGLLTIKNWSNVMSHRFKIGLKLFSQMIHLTP